MSSVAIASLGGPENVVYSDSYVLELLCRENSLKMDLINRDERERRLRLQMLFLEEQSEVLGGQRESDVEKNATMKQELNVVKNQLKLAQGRIQAQDIEIRRQIRELNKLKAELGSLNEVSSDSAKILTEKLGLVRELAMLKPELDHLRAQIVYQQTALSEKLALQRQVSTLEVELETTKQILKRDSRRGLPQEKDSDLRQQTIDLRQELSVERREREKTQKAAQKDLRESDSQREILQKKLEALRTKLQLTVEQLEQARAELPLHQTSSNTTTQGTSEKTVLTKPRKRAPAQKSVGINLETPDGVSRRGRRSVTHKGTSDQAVVGEKSMFSVTPFLNRLQQDQGQSEMRPDSYSIAGTAQHSDKVSTDNILMATGLPTAQDGVGEKDPQDMVVSKQVTNTGDLVLEPSRSSMHVAKKTLLRARIIRTLDDVEEGEGEDNNGGTIPPAPNASVAIGSVRLVENSEPKKRKRKLGVTTTLFDEDDFDMTRKPSKVTLSAAWAQRRAGANKVGISGLTTGQYGAFSPLKRDKRGPQASFL